MFFRQRCILRRFPRYISYNIQYASDFHVDANSSVPPITPTADYLAVCGDLGNPKHPQFTQFFKIYSKQYKKIFFVAGNHDYDCSSLYKEHKKISYKPLIQQITSQFQNVYFLDREYYQLSDNILIAGATLWSAPLITKYPDHTNEHQKDVTWLKNICHTYSDKRIVVLTHYVPTFKLIETRYKERGLFVTSWFASELDYMMEKPIVAWICGHSHSIIETNINGVYCGINAVGHNAICVTNRTIQLSE